MLGLLNRPPLRHKNAKDVHGIITWYTQEVMVIHPEFSS